MDSQLLNGLGQGPLVPSSVYVTPTVETELFVLDVYSQLIERFTNGLVVLVGVKLRGVQRQSVV